MIIKSQAVHIISSCQLALLRWVVSAVAGYADCDAMHIDRHRFQIQGKNGKVYYNDYGSLVAGVEAHPEGTPVSVTMGGFPSADGCTDFQV